MNMDALKRQAALQAVSLVENGMVVGLGTGSTAAFAVAGLGERVKAGLKIVAIPTSERTAALARAAGIKLVAFAEYPSLDITIDGADEVSPALDLVKGLGGALLREKIVAAASARLVIIIDDSKLVPRLGSKALLPVEITSFGLEATSAHLSALGAEPTLRRQLDGTPYVTDNGNHILDCRFPPINNPAVLQDALRRIPGVVESGLFVGMAERVIVAAAGGVREMMRECCSRQ